MNPSNVSIQPYLFFGGRCEEAIEFYRKALGAEVERLVRFKDAPEPQHEMPECFQDKIMHASLRIGDTLLMASDGRCEGPAAFEGFSLSITVPDEAEANRVWDAPGQIRRWLDGLGNAQAAELAADPQP
jgi:PhnB protein